MFTAPVSSSLRPPKFDTRNGRCDVSRKIFRVMLSRDCNFWSGPEPSSLANCESLASVSGDLLMSLAWVGVENPLCN